jgi:DnaJ-class molecular chaperone
MEKKISLIEALSGTNFEIKHLDGKNIKVAIK